MRIRIRLICIAIFSLWWPCIHAETPQPDLPTLDASGARIASITIENGSVFDLEDPDEDKSLYRFANKVHVTTRTHVIEQQLLFAEGDSYSKQQLEESERILRSNRYIQDAKIEPVLIEDGVVDLRVTTADVWSLIPKLSLSRAGGENKFAFGVNELNLFGTGIAVEALYESDVDRDSTVLKLRDRHLGNSWYGLGVRLESNSDGHMRALKLGKPFYSLDARDANGLSYLDNDRIDSFYEHGEIAAQFRHRVRNNEMFYGWSKGLQHGWTRRYSAGLAYDEHHFSAATDSETPISVLPGDRELFYPFVGIELVQDKYEKTTNHNQIHRTEDRFLGTRLNARLGLSRADLGSDRDAWIFGVQAQKGFGNSEKSSLILSTGFGGRYETNGLQDFALDMGARYYKRQTDSRLFFASLSGIYSHNLDADRQILLGGDNGLRGYPLRYQAGDKSVLLTLEQRVFTNWYPFHLFHVGAAVFFDAGRVWGDGPFATNDGEVLKDVGFGLRIGSTRSGLGHVAHVDVAFPLDGPKDLKGTQFIVSLKKSF